MIEYFWLDYTSQVVCLAKGDSHSGGKCPLDGNIVIDCGYPQLLKAVD